MTRTLPVLAVLALAAAAPAAAQIPVDVRASGAFYGDNTEFRGDWRKGDTTLGVHARAFLVARPAERLEIRLGAFGNQRFGSDDAFEHVRPVLAVAWVTDTDTFVFGTLEVMHAEDGPGPDQTGLHGLIPPLQEEVLAFTRPYEAGLQWRAHHERFSADTWLSWQRLAAPSRREVFDVGTAARVRLAGPFSLGLQAHEVHQGGQIAEVGIVGDSLAYGAGLIVEPEIGEDVKLTFEGYGLLSIYDPDRSVEGKEHGRGLFVRAAGVKGPWRAHGLLWRGSDFLKEEGDLNYMSVLRIGTRFTETRVYEEVGLTRTFGPLAGVSFETSARLHHIQDRWDYSYRLLARFDLSWEWLKGKPAERP